MSQLAGGSALAQAAPVGFACTGEAFIVQELNARVSVVDQSLATFTFTDIPNQPTGIEINNLGFRRPDGLLYGLEVILTPPTSTTQIVQIDSTGTVFGLGLPAGLPGNIGANAGDVSIDGSTLFVNLSGAGTLYRVPLPGLTPVASVAITGSTTPPENVVLDWAVNPNDGKLYGADRENQVVQLDPATGVRTDFPVAGLPSADFGGAWFNSAGRLFLFDNDGVIFEVDLGPLAAPTPTIVGSQSGPASIRNDAAACVQDIIGLAKRMTITVTGLPATVEIVYTFENFSINQTLFEMTATDDLTAVFGTHGTDWTFTSITSSNIVHNSGFNGHSDTELIEQTAGSEQDLAPLTTASITVTLQLLTANAADVNGEFCNGVLVIGQDATGALFADQSAAGTDPDPDGDGSPDEQSLACVSLPALTLDKTGVLDPGGDGVANPGDLINYSFAVTNTGTVTLTNVSVVDPMVAPITCPSGNPIPSLAVGVTETCTALYALTQADVDAGQKVNTATADSDQTPPVDDTVTVRIPDGDVIIPVLSPWGLAVLAMVLALGALAVLRRRTPHLG